MAVAGGVSTATAQGVLATQEVVVSHRTSRNDGSCSGATTPSARPPAYAIGGVEPTAYTHLATRAVVPRPHPSLQGQSWCWQAKGSLRETVSEGWFR